MDKVSSYNTQHKTSVMGFWGLSNMRLENLSKDGVDYIQNYSDLELNRVQSFEEGDSFQNHISDKIPENINKEKSNICNEISSINLEETINLDYYSQTTISDLEELGLVVDDLNSAEKSNTNLSEISLIITKNRTIDLTESPVNYSENDLECHKDDETKQDCFYCRLPSGWDQITYATCGHRIHNSCLNMYFKDKMKLLIPRVLTLFLLTFYWF